MPRSRRRHHSRSRSRSHSHDRDREPKRRRVESPDSHHRRSVSDDSEVTPKKTIMSPKQVQKKLDSQKKRQLEKEEREKKRQEEKLKREEQKRKEREEKEEQKRKEKEEKEEQRRKEKEEKEEQKRKEREEKEELKKKEREEKEEQKKKEREEKDEQKRKEREEKELKKQQELEEKNRDKKKKEEQIEKEKAAFVNFFVPRKSASAADFKKPEEAKTYAFMPFAVKSDMRLAPVIRHSLSDDQKQNLVEKLCKQMETTVLYLNEIKNGKKLGCSSRTWPMEDGDVVILEDTDIGECVVEQPKTTEKMRAKLLKFHENRRPAYFGTWRKKSKRVNPRKPFALEELFDYEVESDDDWEEEEPGESLHGSDDEEKENESDDYEVDNEFFVPHAYLSDDEKEAEENAAMSPETQKEKLKLLQIEFDEEMKSKTERIKPRLIGCIWENKLVPKVQDAINRFLQDRMMIITGTVTIQKRDVLNTSVKLTGSTKQVTPGRKLLSQELIPEFLQLIHGNTNNRGLLVNEFINYMSMKGVESNASKSGISCQLKQFAKWKKCPDEGVMLNKLCWYVDEEVRNQYNVNLTLPNKWTYTSEETTGARRKLIVS